MNRGTTVVLPLALAAAALVVACGGGDSEPAPEGPTGIIGSESGIAFIGKDPESASPNLYLVDADSGAVQQLTDTEEFEWWPTWSRDRQRLGFIAWPAPKASQEATPAGTAAATPAGTPTPTPAATLAPEDIIRRHIVVANADGSDQRSIGDSILLQSFSGGFSWSPDNSAIVYMAAVDPAEKPLRSKLRMVNVADGSDVPLKEQRLGYLPAWSPDGTKIAFGAFVGELDEEGQGENELFLMDGDGSNVRQITDRPGTDVAPAWSPDGTRIVWWGEAPQADPSQEPTPLLFMMDVASGEITELGGGSDPVWSPDGQHFAFIVEEEPPPGVARLVADTNIYIIDVATGERKVLDQHPAPDQWPTWSSDGQRIAFISQRDQPQGEIYVIDATGGEARRLTDNTLNEGMLAWAPQ